MQLKDKVAIITGASSGIGEATAWELSRLGVRLVLAARRLPNLQELAGRIHAEGGMAVAVQCDVTDRAQVESLARLALKEFGRIDVLINNAGIMPLSFVKKNHVDEWERMVDVNLKGPLFAISAVLPSMLAQKQGHIVNVSSVAGRRLFPGGAIYCGTKHALSAISEGLRGELAASEGIRVTDIQPGAVKTELLTTITDQDILEGFQKRTFAPLEALDIARAVAYALTQPDHVDVSQIYLMPTAQG